MAGGDTNGNPFTQRGPAAREARILLLRKTQKSDYVEMSGRPIATLNDQARRYGIPIGGRTVDVPAVIRWMHDWFKSNRVALMRTRNDDEDPMLTIGGDSPALERYRMAKAQLAEVELGVRQGNVLTRDELQSGFARIAEILRGAGTALGKQFGPEAQGILDEALDDAERIMGDI